MVFTFYIVLFVYCLVRKMFRESKVHFSILYFYDEIKMLFFN